LAGDPTGVPVREFEREDAADLSCNNFKAFSRSFATVK
jgi:hypothetical protein